MRTEHLAEFIALAHSLSFNVTASVLGIAQPTLSKHIATLEDELGASLFKRGSASISLTEAGERMLPYAYQVVDIRNRMVEEARRCATSSKPHLRFGGYVVLKSVLKLIAPVAASLSAAYGPNAVSIDDSLISWNGGVYDMGCDGMPDIAFVLADDGDEVANSTEIRCIEKMPLYCVVGEGHRFVGRDSVTLDDLAREKLIKLEGIYPGKAWRFIELACEKAGFAPRCRHEYFPRETDLLRITNCIGSDVLLLTDDYIDHFGALISPSCTSVLVDDDRASIPLSIVYDLNNPNPLIDDAVEALLAARE